MMNDIIQGNERYRLPWEIRHFLLEHCLLMTQAWSIRQWTNYLCTYSYSLRLFTCHLLLGIRNFRIPPAGRRNRHPKPTDFISLWCKVQGYFNLLFSIIRY